MRSIRLSLSVKILLVAALNAALALFALAATRVGPWPFSVEDLVLSASADHVQDVTRRFEVELSITPREQWDRMAADYAAEYHADFLLIQANGTQVAGRPLPIPDRLARRLAGPRPERGQLPGLFGGPPRGPSAGPSAGPIAAERFRPPPPCFFLISPQAPHYWIGASISVPSRPGAVPAGDTLLIVSNDVFTNPFLARTVRSALLAMATIVIAIVCWVPLLRGLTRAIHALESATARIAEGRFDNRVDERRGDELGRLGRAINQMASRIETLVSGQTRFLGDTAHELRSPLGRMQVAIELLDQRVGDSDRQYLRDVRDDIDELVRLTDDLLEFTRTRLSGRDEPLRPTDVGHVIARVLRVEGKGADISTLVPDGLMAMARPDDLLRALSNIVRNAVRYAGHAGPVCLSADRHDDVIQIVVADAGPGVPDEALERIFSPFYRVDPSRARRSGGTGLGLAIARSAIEASGGSVVAANRRPSGLELRLTLPAA